MKTMARSALLGLCRQRTAAILVLALVLLWPAPGRAVEYYWGSHPDKERLVVVFPQGIPAHTVERTGKNSLAISLPQGFWNANQAPESISLADAEMLKEINAGGQGFQVDLNTDAFRIKYFTLAEQNKLVVDFYRDPEGAGWTQSQQAAAKPSPKQETPTPTPAPAPEDNGPPMPADKPEEPWPDPASADKAIARQTKEGESPFVADQQKGEPFFAVPYTFRSPINTGGPEDWYRPEQTADIPASQTAQLESATKSVSSIRLPVAPEAEPKLSEAIPDEQAEVPEPQVEIVQGPEPAETPGEFVNASNEAALENQALLKEKEAEDLSTEEAFSELFSAQAALNNGDYDNALTLFNHLRNDPRLSQKDQEEVLYSLGDTLYGKHRDNPAAAFDKIVGAYAEAMNFNSGSHRIPAALLRLGVLHMKAGNLREAQAHFNILQQKHPEDSNIPLIYYYWGEYYYKTAQFQNAADQFQVVVQDFPDSTYVREASVGLARSLNKLGYDEQAFQIADYIEKRWPRFYAEYPPFLQLTGDVAYRSGNLDKAKVDYWTYYNLAPQGEDADILLARLGDIYVQTEQLDAAREVYQEAATQFPERDGGLIAKMRLAEEGIYDEPSVEAMFSIFDRPYNESPKEIYTEILEKHPDSSLAPLAQIKMSIWHLWNRRYMDALEEAEVFSKKFSDSKMLPRAKEVAMQAFQSLVQGNLPEENFERILSAWNQFTILRANEDMLIDEARVSLALSFSKRDLPESALIMLEPFFRGNMGSDFSEMALHLALSILLENEAWGRLIDLSNKVELWELSPESERELNYSLALAYQNLGQEDKALPLWADLVEDTGLEEAKRAYPLYYLAYNARQENDLRKAHLMATTSLSLLAQNTENMDTAKVKDLLSLLMDVTEKAGRPLDALDWARKYSDYVEPGDPDWPSLQYRTAQLYKQTNDPQRWASILNELKEQSPESLYGRMAASELKTHTLEQAAQRFTPVGQL